MIWKVEDSFRVELGFLWVSSLSDYSFSYIRVNKLSVREFMFFYLSRGDLVLGGGRVRFFLVIFEISWSDSLVFFLLFWFFIVISRG